MSELFDAFWRAAAYCLHPRAILLSLLPMAAAAAAVFALGWVYWEVAVAGVRAALEDWALVGALYRWLEAVGAAHLRSMVAPLIVIALAVPMVVVLTLVLVAVLMTPALVRWVAARRFPGLERRRGASWLASLGWSLGHMLVAAAALVLSLPLWLIPPLLVLLPPLILGWLSWRVMAFDVLAEHASRDERRRLMHARRWPLFGMGLATGWFSALPSLVWLGGALVIPFAPLLIPLSVWLYTLVFVFSALWFAHYALAALARERALPPGVAAPAPSVPGPALAPPAS